MKVTYIYHSCFVVELDNHILIFDYYKGELPEFDSSKKIYFFASHFHQDHFNVSVLKYAYKYPYVRFVLSNDIRLGANFLIRNGLEPSVKDLVTVSHRNEDIELDELKIQALRSTDSGVAYLVSVEDRNIFHAGDLNWWIWKEEGKAFGIYMERGFKDQLIKIKDIYLDVAFLVLDPRMKEDMTIGLFEFMKTCSYKRVFPMHMWEHYDIICKVKSMDEIREISDKLMEYSAEGQSFILD